MKRFFFTLILFLILTNCDFRPIYSTEKINFSVKEIIVNDSNKLNKSLAKSLNFLTEIQNTNQLILNININKSIEIKTRNSKGDPEIFEMILILEIQTSNKDNIINTKNLRRNINYNNNSDKFKLNQYEKDLEEILLSKLVEDVLKYLSNLQ
ncbi:hypothetical protein HIMB5_00013620 [alpha proteobacterium HIMB5]|nr:hypothetical protein HIMB5_00013620 [alpha proteobacterium HIMB5]